MLLVALFAAQASAQEVADPVGEAIYRRGILPSGQPITAKREPDLQISGGDAACSNCHRRSGLGELEGHIRIPPVTGAALFRPRVHDGNVGAPPNSDAAYSRRDAYSKEALARAIREGVAVDGSQLNYLMPHYSLADADMASLIGYLKGLTRFKSPGVNAGVLHLATIVTPDADPVKRRAMLDVLDHYFADTNAAALAGGLHSRSPQGAMSMPNYRWQLHIWELTGPASAWDQQLRTHLEHEPVLAVISGVGGKTWAPIHRFCEQAGLPCLFPNVDLPVVAEHDFYSLYFSRGVLLEADLIAHAITGDKRLPAAHRVVQIYRRDDIGQQAANALRGGVAGVDLVDRPLRTGNGKQQLAAALRDIGSRDVVVLWLRPQDLALLAALPSVHSRVFISGLMGGLDQSPVPAASRGVAVMVYAFDLPDHRVIQTDYPLGWFRINHIPVIDQRVQTDTWLACVLLSETLSHMSDSFVRDYLVERLEGMLDHQMLTGYYPRLSLAPNQRFASKGGYLVKFAEPSGSRLVAESEWIVP